MREVVTASALVLCLAAVAGAQERPRADLFAGYSLVRSEGESLHGGEVALAWHVSDHLSVVLDLDAHGRTIEGVDHTTSGVLAGPRLGFRAGGITPFVHALLGVVRDEDSVTVFTQTISERHTGAGGALGGGLDFGSRRLGGRVQADYRLWRRGTDGGGTETHGDPRISAGAVFRFGAR